MNIEQYVKTDLSKQLSKQNPILKEITYNVKSIDLKKFENDSNEKMQNNLRNALVSNPKPVVVEGKKYCPECWNNNIESELRGSRQFLCKEHYREFRHERERIRLKLKREGYDVTEKDGQYHKVKTNKAKEYNTKLGTSDFGSSLTKNKQKKPDFEKEKKFVQNEKKRIWNSKTIGNFANKKAGESSDAHFFEDRERLLDQGNLAYKEEFDGYIQYDSEGVKLDEWSVNFEESNDKKAKSLKDIYKDWQY